MRRGKSGGLGRRGGVRVEDVARAAGVSPISVSRALHNPGRVSAATRQKVEEAVVRTGYTVNSFASALRSGRSHIVPVFVSTLLNPHFANALQGAQDALEGSGYHLLMAQTNYSEVLEDEMVNSVLPFRPAAVMFTGMVHSQATREKLRGTGIPVMEMWDFAPDPIDMLVGFSNAEGGELVGAHFAERGYRRVAYVGRTRERGAQRLSGFRKGLARAGRKPVMLLAIEGTPAQEDGARALDEVLRRHPDCDAIFFATDILVVGALARARERGLDLPRELAIAGFGDLDVTRHVSPPITTVHVASHDMGRAAGGMVLQRLLGRPVTDRIVRFPVRLEARASTLG